MIGTPMTEALPTEDELRDRTARLLKAAESVSLELQLQTERLNAALELFDREVVEPLRKELDSQ